MFSDSSVSSAKASVSLDDRSLSSFDSLSPYKSKTKFKGVNDQISHEEIPDLCVCGLLYYCKSHYYCCSSCYLIFLLL